jgi:DNA-binding transcriptional ArsR family regulator
MPRVSDDSLLGALTAASDSTRLQILLHAARNGVVRTRDAKGILKGSPRSGTVSYHLAALTRAGLLVRAGRGEYRLTSAGTLITRLGGELAGDCEQGGDDLEDRGGEMMIRISETSGRLGDLLPLATELVAEVRRTRISGVVDQERVRLSRLE